MRGLYCQCMVCIVLEAAGGVAPQSGLAEAPSYHWVRPCRSSFASFLPQHHSLAYVYWPHVRLPSLPSLNAFYCRSCRPEDGRVAIIVLHRAPAEIMAYVNEQDGQLIARYLTVTTRLKKWRKALTKEQLLYQSK